LRETRGRTIGPSGGEGSGRGETKWRLVAAVLNSEIIEFVLCQLTNSIRRGFVRMFADSTEELPIIEPDNATAAALEHAVGARDQNAGNALTAEPYAVTAGERCVLSGWFERRSLVSRSGDEPDADEFDA